MTSTIHPIRGREPGRLPRDVGGAGSEPLPVIRTVASEGIVCTVLSRSGRNVAARRGRRRARSAPFTAIEMLEEHRGFLAALSAIYGTELKHGFDRVAYIEELRATPAFVVDEVYRVSVIAELCRRALRTSGFVAMRPGPDSWQLQQSEVQPTAPAWNHELMLCHLLGSSGFAQLCDDEVLDEPVPLFVRPWQADRGLLPPVELPRKRFSRTLRAHRLCVGRMILFQDD